MGDSILLSPFMEKITMDINIIDYTISELEENAETLDDLADLANLYIVRDKIKSKDVTQSEYNDILPTYNQYVNNKRAYQLGQINEGAVIKDIKSLCTEIQEFIDTLYSCTDMNKERKCIKDMLFSLHNKYSD